MFKRLGTDSYLCDAKEDLKNLPEKDLGAEAYVIKESTTYRLMSTGEWVRQGNNVAGSSAEVDLTGYATEKYVDTKVSEIKIPSVSNFVKKEDLQGYATEVELQLLADNPVLKAFDFERNPSREDGQAIYLTAEDSTTLAQAMQEKGIGIYNIWLQKGRADLPKSMITTNTSGRGFACVDLQTATNPEAFIGYAILFDKKNNMFYQFMNKGTIGPWMKISAVED